MHARCSSLLAFIEKKMHKRVAACNTPHLATATPHKSLRDKLHEKLHRVTGPLHTHIRNKNGLVNHSSLVFYESSTHLRPVRVVTLFELYLTYTQNKYELVDHSSLVFY